MAASVQKHEAVGKLVFERSSFQDSREKHRNCISEHYFNSAIHVLYPSVSAMPSEVDDIMSKQISYLAKNVSLQLLLSMDFIEGFVKKGVLVLNLSKDTFQQLGLEGKLAKHGTSYIGHEKHVVEIELLNPKFFPEMKQYERVKWCLSDRLDLTFDFLLSWKPNDAKVCPSSIQNFFQTNGCVCKRMKIPKKTMKYENFKVPVILPDTLLERDSKNRPGAYTVIESLSTQVLQENRVMNKPVENERQIHKDKSSESVFNDNGHKMLDNDNDMNVSKEDDIHTKLTHDTSMTIDLSSDDEGHKLVTDKNGRGDYHREQASCGYLEVFEWLGACAVGVDIDNDEESTSNYVCSLTCPSPNITLNYGVSVEYRGLITPHTIQDLIDVLRKDIHTRRKKDMTWCCVSVHGFQDSPVSWTKRVHGFCNNGDNLYSLVMFNNDTYWLYRAFGAKDVAT